MALVSTNYANQMLNALDASGTPTNLATHLGLHPTSPGTTGTNELTGGGYTRQACAWNTASGGTKTNSGAPTFTTSGGTAIGFMNTWSASTSGTPGLGITLTSPVTAVTITVAAGALTASAS